MSIKNLFLILILFLPLLILGQTSSRLIKSYTVSVDPAGTYLRTNADSASPPASFSLLGRENITTGSILHLNGYW